MRRWLLVGMVPLLMAQAPVRETQISPAPGDVSLTIYNSGIALVQEKRRLTLPAGRTRVEFRGVSTAIRPETVSLAAPDLSVVEQNFDYDLLTPAKMMEKAVGKDITIVRTNPATGQETRQAATVLSVNAGVILKIGDHIEVLRDDGIPTRVIFDGIPQELRASPTLSVTVEAAKAGPRDAMLSYLSNSLGWHADYVANLDASRTQVSLHGLVTLNSVSGTSFNDATVRLVAQAPTQGQQPGPNAIVRPGTGARGAADFPVYALPGKVTVAANQTKQVGFLDLDGLKARTIYHYSQSGFYNGREPAHVDSVLAFSNSGAAMPAGTVRVYMPGADGAAKFVGEQAIGATPAGSDIEVVMGAAFDITAQPTIVATEKLAGNRTRQAMRYEFRNAGDAAVEVRFQQDGLQQNGEIGNESQPGQRLNAAIQQWLVSVPAHGATTLTFTATTG
jgi:hypothetical protein